MWIWKKKWLKWAYLQNRNRVTDAELPSRKAEGEIERLRVTVHTTMYKIGNK